MNREVYDANRENGRLRFGFSTRDSGLIIPLDPELQEEIRTSRKKDGVVFPPIGFGLARRMIHHTPEEFEKVEKTIMSGLASGAVLGIEEKISAPSGNSRKLERK